MSRKRLDENVIVNELKGSSVFFREVSDSPTSPESTPHKNVLEESHSIPQSTKSNVPIKAPESNWEGEAAKQTKDSSQQESDHDSVLASYQPSMINAIRKSVKALGKEVSFVRLTPEEKNQVVDIVYTYRRQGVRTSENEIHRIALNFLLSDFKANGKSSVLARVIEALLA